MPIFNSSIYPNFIPIVLLVVMFLNLASLYCWFKTRKLLRLRGKKMKVELREKRLWIMWVYHLDRWFSFWLSVRQFLMGFFLAASTKAFNWTSSSWSDCGNIISVCSAASRAHLWSENQGRARRVKGVVVLADWDISLRLSGWFWMAASLVNGLECDSFLSDIFFLIIIEASSAPCWWYQSGIFCWRWGWCGERADNCWVDLGELETWKEKSFVSLVGRILLSHLHLWLDVDNSIYNLVYEYTI